MKYNSLLFAVIYLGTLSPLAAVDLPPVPRFSTSYMDTTVPPGVDFARYAWGNWSKDNPLPADKSRWGSIGQLDQYNQACLKAILEAAASKPHEPGSIEQKVGDFFASAMDTAAIDAAGTKPIAADLAQIAAINNLTDLARVLAALHNQGVSGMFIVS